MILNTRTKQHVLKMWYDGSAQALPSKGTFILVLVPYFDWQDLRTVILSSLSICGRLLPNTPPPPQVCASVNVSVDGASVLLKPRQIRFSCE